MGILRVIRLPSFCELESVYATNRAVPAIGKSGAHVYVKVEAMHRNPLISIIFVILAV